MTTARELEKIFRRKNQTRAVQTKSYALPLAWTGTRGKKNAGDEHEGRETS